LPLEIGRLIRHDVQINLANNVAASTLIRRSFCGQTGPGCAATSVRRPTIRLVRLKFYFVAGVVSGIAAYLLGASPVWSVVTGAIAPAVLAAVPHFVRGAIAGLRTADDVAAEMSGTEFEDYVARVVRSSGAPVIMTSVTGDWGVDIIVGTRPNRLAIQCKRQARPVGTSAIQQVVAGAPMQECTRTMVVTNHEFTPAARKLAELHDCELVGRAELPRLRSTIRRLTASA
jgi:restriction system protein